MDELIRYQLFCIDEGTTVLTDYTVYYPTKCPNNENHVIDASTIAIYHKFSTKTVTINQNSNVHTGGYYRIDQYSLEVPDIINDITNHDISYPYNVSIYTIRIMVTPENIGDTYEIISYPDTIVGQLTTDLLMSQNELTLPTVMSLNPGFKLTVNGTDLGFISSVDIINNKIYSTVAAPNDFPIGSIVRISVPRLLGGKVVNNQDFTLGMCNLGSSGLEAGKIIRLTYKNITGGAKTLNFLLELQY